MSQTTLAPRPRFLQIERARVTFMAMPQQPASARASAPGPRATLLMCIALLAVFAGMAFFSVRSKSPTYDEPLHALSAYLQRHARDFRVDSEDPPLWKYWAAIPMRRDSLHAPTDVPIYNQIADDLYHEWQYTVETLYRMDENIVRSDDFIMRGRVMMIVLGVVLGAMIAWWGWQVGGSIAAITAAVLFCFDPNFLAHAALVKNDVPLTLCATGLIFAVWRAGRRLTIWNALAIGLFCAAAVTVKYSGLIFGPIVALLMILRAVMPQPWQTFWRTLDFRTDKLVAAFVVLASAALLSYGGIWAAYQFRFGPSPDPSVQLNLRQMVVYASMAELIEKRGRQPTTQEAAAWQPSRMVRTIMTMDDMHFLPQPWLYGLLYTYQSALLRKTFLLGKFSDTGWWYYFPVAILTKTTLATLLAAAAAIGVLWKRSDWRGKEAIYRNWTALCLFIPPAIFLALAMRSNLNLGLRHVLPIYPFLYIGIGLAVAAAWERWRSIARWATPVLAIGLAAETLFAFPNYLAFFNAPAGGSRGGLRILGDSNLDWGQDLKLLAEWQQKHPGVNLYLVYFGLSDPWAYGIKYVNFPGGYDFGPRHEITAEPGVLAISATQLQGIYNEPDLRDAYARLNELKPLDVLGGTIYLYRWPPPKIKQALNP